MACGTGGASGAGSGTSGTAGSTLTIGVGAGGVRAEACFFGGGEDRASSSRAASAIKEARSPRPGDEGSTGTVARILWVAGVRGGGKEGVGFEGAGADTGTEGIGSEADVSRTLRCTTAWKEDLCVVLRSRAASSEAETGCGEGIDGRVGAGMIVARVTVGDMTFGGSETIFASSALLTLISEVTL